MDAELELGGPRIGDLQGAGGILNSEFLIPNSPWNTFPPIILEQV